MGIGKLLLNIVQFLQALFKRDTFRFLGRFSPHESGAAEET